MGTNLIALMKYEGAADQILEAIKLFESYPPGVALKLIGVETTPELFVFDAPEHAKWEIWSGSGYLPSSQPLIPNYAATLTIPPDIDLTFGNDTILIGPSRYRWSALFHDEIQANVITILTDLCLAFHAQDCLVTHDYSDLLDAFEEQQPFSEILAIGEVVNSPYPDHVALSDMVKNVALDPQLVEIQWPDTEPLPKGYQRRYVIHPRRCWRLPMYQNKPRRDN